MGRPANSCNGSSVLRERIVTAVVLAALLLGSLLSDKPVLYSLLLGAFVSVAAWEWAGLIHCRQTRQRVLYAVLLILPLPFLYFSISTFWVAFVVLVGVVGWLVAAIMVLGYQVDGQFVPAGRPAGILTGLLVLVPAWTGLVWLYPQRQGPQLILLFFAPGNRNQGSNGQCHSKTEYQYQVDNTVNQG